MQIRLTCMTLVAGLGLGCAAGTTTAPSFVDDYGVGGSTELAMPRDMDCNDTPPTYEQVAAFNTCVMCHAASKTGADRKSAPVGIDFDTEANADAHSAQAVSAVMAGYMPPAAAGVKLSAADKQALYAWALCHM